MLTVDRLTAMSYQECLRLLREHQHHIGRLAYDDGLPTILPVNYVLDVDRIVIRTAPGSKLDIAMQGLTVAFSIDSIASSEPKPDHAWSVLVRGPASVVGQDAEAEFLRLSQIDPWAGGLKPHFITVELETVTGRKF